jgi:hypothetical protein
MASHVGPRVEDIKNSSGFSGGGDVNRIIDAARSPDWSIGLRGANQIMATNDSGVIGMPWVVTAERAGKGMRVSCFQPGDDVNAEGEVIGELQGNPRTMGRQLRDLLEMVGERKPS